MQVVFKYALGHSVVVPGNGFRGKVKAVYLDVNSKNPSYLIKYEDKNGALFEHYFDEKELLESNPDYKEI